MRSSAGASRMSSVRGLKASPHTATLRPRISPPKCVEILSPRTFFWARFVSWTADSTRGTTPFARAIAASAWTSLGKQLPPYPTPGKRNANPIRLSWPIPRRTSSMSASIRSQRFATSLMKLIFVDNSALATYFVISALSGDMTRKGCSVRR